jgi:hypothetical protein
VVAVAKNSTVAMLLVIMTIAIRWWISDSVCVDASSGQSVPQISLGLRTDGCESHRHSHWSADDSHTGPTPSGAVLDNARMIMLAMSKLIFQF